MKQSWRLKESYCDGPRSEKEPALTAEAAG